MRTHHFALVALFCSLQAVAQAPAATPVPAQPSAEQGRDALLQAMGGAALWRQVIGVRIVATHYSSETRLPYRNVIWNDFRRFRLRIEASNSELTRVFDYDGELGWRDDGVRVTRLTDSAVASERAWWSANVYRTLHRLALPDAALSVRWIEPQRLAIEEKGKGLLAWFRLGPGGEPLQFGSDANTPGSTFGPLNTHASGLRYPRWGSNATGSWRYEVHDAEFVTRALVMPELPILGAALTVP